MQSLGNLTISAGVPATFKAPPTSLQALVIGNESGLSVVIKLEGCGIEKTLYPGTVDVFPINYGFSGMVFITPTLAIATAILYPGSFLSFDAVGIGDNLNAGAYPLSLARPMTAGASSPQSGFSAASTFVISGSPTHAYGLNIFNPANSGVIARVYSAQAMCSDLPATTPKAWFASVVQRTDGTNNNFANAATVIQHNIAGTATTNTSTSKMLATFFANLDPTSPPNVFVATWSQTTLAYDFLSPPDCLYVNPGQNLLIEFQNPNINGMYITMILKWTEQ